MSGQINKAEPQRDVIHVHMRNSKPAQHILQICIYVKATKTFSCTYNGLVVLCAHHEVQDPTAVNFLVSIWEPSWLCSFGVTGVIRLYSHPPTRKQSLCNIISSKTSLCVNKKSVSFSRCRCCRAVYSTVGKFVVLIYLIVKLLLWIERFDSNMSFTAACIQLSVVLRSSLASFVRNKT